MMSNNIQILVIFFITLFSMNISAQEENTEGKSKSEIYLEKKRKAKEEAKRKRWEEEGLLYEKDGVSYLKYNWREDLPQQEITSEMHRKNIGKILFSNEKIQFGSENPSKIKTKLTSGDHIYGRMYLLSSIPNDTVYVSDDPKNSPREVTRGNKYRSAMAEYLLYINGELSNWRIQNVTFDDENLHHTTRQVWLAPKPEDEPVSDYWFEELDKLPDGEHKIRIEYVPFGKSIIRPLAAGEFTLVKSADNMLSTGATFSSLEEGRRDATLASKALEIMKKTYKEKRWDGTVKKVKFRTDWVASYVGPYSNRSKIREIRLYAYVTHPNGNCMVEEFTIAQSHNGNAFSGPYFYRRVIPSSKKRVDCD
ncbi:hypothetical protein KIM67_13230 [Flagellimonas sp. 389]|uniref:hypothetical protein n=1 Tax=Flagellimonas sp. 389 TaxID=2835862 RepID=UPI001BD4DB91|nr:hypothetical protein [Flagellimonas sp. 389]MBS9463375.1 hypothetical protein [Flagellimonas sp. 389]